MTSERRLEANKRNARLGGVKTRQGKDISKYNALRHGILRHCVTKYEENYYNDILERLKQHLKPQTMLEELLIERIATAHLQLDRAQKAESEYIMSILNPRRIRYESPIDLSVVTGKDTVENEGYTPLITPDVIERLSTIYCRYEGTIENRFYRAIHEFQKLTIQVSTESSATNSNSNQK